MLQSISSRSVRHRHRLKRSAFALGDSSQYRLLPARCFSASSPPVPISVQLDYYMGPQFSGLAVALDEGIYADRGLSPAFMPTCPPGLEALRVRSAVRGGEAVVGVTEQNILIDCLHDSPSLDVSAVSGMFRESPLQLLSLKGGSPQKGAKIGCHDDTVALVERLLPEADVISVPRATKLDLLLDGQIDSVQIYSTTELSTILKSHPELSSSLVSTPFSSYGAELGYGQVIFAPNEFLTNPEHSATIEKFLDATYEGWRMSLLNPSAAIGSIKRVCDRLGLDEEGHTHYPCDDDALLQEIVENCNDLVVETKEGHMLGVLDETRFNSATAYLSHPTVPPPSFGLAPTFYQPPPNLLKGSELSRTLLSSTSKLAKEISSLTSKEPSLTVITVGDHPEGGTLPTASLRRRMYSSRDNSWYDKVSTGKKHGIDVTSTVLPVDASTSDVLRAIEDAKDSDGIQLMWPLPEGIDSHACFSAIQVEKDVDGLVPGSETTPITVDAVLILLEKNGVKVEGKNVLVLGRSKIVGKPLSEKLLEMGATVTVASAETTEKTLEGHLKVADVVVSCVGLTGVVDLSLVKEGCTVVGVGKTFDEDKGYESDLTGEGKVGLYSSSPGGVGPMSVAVLMRNVVDKARKRVERQEERKSKGVLTDAEFASKPLPPGWSGRPLKKTFRLPSHPATLSFLSTVTDLSEKIDHHPDVDIIHKCTEGVEVVLKYETYTVGGVTSKDFEAVEMLEDVMAER